MRVIVKQHIEIPGWDLWVPKKQFFTQSLKSHQVAESSVSASSGNKHLGTMSSPVGHCRDTSLRQKQWATRFDRKKTELAVVIHEFLTRGWWKRMEKVGDSIRRNAASGQDLTQNGI